MSEVSLHLGDCRDVLPTLASGSVDVVLCDPPYPEIDREYGRMTEAEWHAMMRVIVPECRRILKPSGSAVFILQPNSERVGKMRPWLFEFQAWCCREWNMVQDVYWWNLSALPIGGAITAGLLRGSIKLCVWLGDSSCFRDQDMVLWRESERSRFHRIASYACEKGVRVFPSGNGVRYPHAREVAVRRGGTTPFNLIPIAGIGGPQAKEYGGHPAATPFGVVNWWIRYICPPGGVVLDPFCGSGTTGLAALRLHRSFIGIEKHEPYFELSKRRLDGPPAPLFDERLAPPDPHPLFAEADA